LGSDQVIVKPLAVGHLRCAGWPLLMLDPVSVSVVDCCDCWWGERDRRKVGGRNDGGVVVRWE
jgi:hypothetical protein